MEYIDWVAANWEAIATAIMAIIGACAALAKLSPTPRDDEVIGRVMEVVNIIGMNFGNTANKGSR